MRIILVGTEFEGMFMSFYCRQALEKLGHEVYTFDYRKSTFLSEGKNEKIKKEIKSRIRISPQKFIPFLRILETKRMNRRLVEICKKHNPDVVIVLKGEKISPSALRKIKALNIPLINWDCDNPFLDIRDKVYTYYDHFFIFDSYYIPKLYEKKARSVNFLPCACSAEFHRPVILTGEEKSKYSCDICFVGAYHPYREDFFEQLADFKLFIWGWGWDKAKNPRLRECQRGTKLAAEEWVKLYSAAKIVVNIHQPQQSVWGANMRDFEVLGCRAFLLTDYMKDISGLFEIGKEIVCFKDKDELKRLAKYYLDNEKERVQIAQKGYERVCKEHTYVHRFKKLLSFLT
ncbi:MAG: glycosyltransferase [Elusimicrobia bacterium]|nr:glycosyltransferase [Elusimicrobiota bacterium]